MKTTLLTLLSLVIAFTVSCQSSVETSATFTNPVYNKDFPDPTVIRAGDGFFYAYGTQTVHEGEWINIQVARSADLVHWELLEDALPQKPDWARTTQDFWAPHVLYDEGKDTYYMYYSGESDSEAYGKCMGVATSKNPAGPFTDKGEPLLCGHDFVNIDPMAFDDPATGKKLLYWGSGFEPLQVQEMADDRLSFKAGSSAVVTVTPEEGTEYNNLIEGSWVHYRDNYYYLFYSGDNCCGENAKYAVMVARSENALGPFERLGDGQADKPSTILVKNEHWLAPGHNSIFTDDAGQDWLFYHAMPASDPKHQARIMLMDRVLYEDGWPVIENSSPSTERQNIPVIDNSH